MFATDEKTKGNTSHNKVDFSTADEVRQMTDFHF